MNSRRQNKSSFEATCKYIDFVKRRKMTKRLGRHTHEGKKKISFAYKGHLTNNLYMKTKI